MRYIFLVMNFFLLNELSAQEFDYIEITGEYKGFVGFDEYATLNLNPDFTFDQKAYNYYDSWTFKENNFEESKDVEEIIGNYMIEDNKIILQPNNLIKIHFVSDSLVRIDSLEFNVNTSSIKDTLIIVPWSDNIVLLSPKNRPTMSNRPSNEILDFIEYSKAGADELFWGEFWKKKSYKTFNNDLKELIPMPWRLYLLPNLIQANSIQIYTSQNISEKDYIKTIVTINRGEEDGVSYGMKFYSEDEEECACEIDIFEVNNKTSKGYFLSCNSTDCRLGTSFYAFLILK